MSRAKQRHNLIMRVGTRIADPALTGVGFLGCAMAAWWLLMSATTDRSFPGAASSAATVDELSQSTAYLPRRVVSTTSARRQNVVSTPASTW